MTKKKHGSRMRNSKMTELKKYDKNMLEQGRKLWSSWPTYVLTCFTLLFHFPLCNSLSQGTEERTCLRKCLMVFPKLVPK